MKEKTEQENRFYWALQDAESEFQVVRALRGSELKVIMYTEDDRLTLTKKEWEELKVAVDNIFEANEEVG